jgi:protocatechuate 3,4-dioxygenase beta subunit
MHLLFQTTRPLGPGDDDDVGPMGQAIQTCRGQQGGSEQGRFTFSAVCPSASRFQTKQPGKHWKKPEHAATSKVSTA